MSKKAAKELSGVLAKLDDQLFKADIAIQVGQKLIVRVHQLLGHGKEELPAPTVPEVEADYEESDDELPL